MKPFLSSKHFDNAFIQSRQLYSKPICYVKYPSVYKRHFLAFTKGEQFWQIFYHDDNKLLLVRFIMVRPNDFITTQMAAINTSLKPADCDFII